MDNDNSEISNTSTTANTTSIITSTLVPEHLRTTVTADLFGAYFPLQLEPFVFSVSSQLSEDCCGGYWNFYNLTNGGFYMAPDGRDKRYQVISLNGHECFMSADALGITACLYAYSHLSFGQGDFAETCAEHYHLLRAFSFGHAEAGDIFRIID